MFSFIDRENPESPRSLSAQTIDRLYDEIDALSEDPDLAAAPCTASSCRARVDQLKRIAAQYTGESLRYTHQCKYVRVGSQWTFVCTFSCKGKRFETAGYFRE